MRSLLKDINRYFGSKSLKRKALTKPNIIYFRWRYISNRYRTSGVATPTSLRRSPALAEELKRRGIAVRSCRTAKKLWLRPRRRAGPKSPR